MSVAQMEPVQVVWENLCPIFRLSDKWYIRQMKLFNFMNCRASWTLDKSQISPSVTKLGTPSLTLKISQKWWMSSEQRIANRITKNTDYSWKITSIYIYYIYIYYIYVQNKISQGMEKYYYEGPTFKFGRGSWGLTFKLQEGGGRGSWSHFYAMPKLRQFFRRDLVWRAVRWENFERSQYSKWVTET